MKTFFQLVNLRILPKKGKVGNTDHITPQTLLNALLLKKVQCR